MNYKTSAELKAYARGKLLGKYGVTVGALALEVLIFSIVGQIISRVVDRNTIEGLIIYGIIMIIVSLISVIFEVGELVIFMKISCGDKPLVIDLFKGFTLHPDKIITIGFIRFGLVFLCFVPAAIAGGVSAVLEFSNTSVLVAILTAIVSMILAIYVRISLSQMLFVLLDFPEYTAKEIIACSREIIRGRKGMYLYVMISFLPLYILSILSFGIAHMLVLPYIRMTETEFYMDTIKGPGVVNRCEAGDADNHQGFEVTV